MTDTKITDTEQLEQALREPPITHAMRNARKVEIPDGAGLKLPVRTVDELMEEAGEDVPWIVEDILARGALTDFYGPAKRGGKTTFWCHAITAGARGEDVAGFATVPAKYLYLTEQVNNFALSLKDSGLSEHKDHVRIVQFKDVSGFEWTNLIQNAAADCKALGFDARVVDTFAKFGKLKGSEENESGPVLDRLRVLNMEAQRHNIGTVLIRHAGKDGKARGSSGFEGEADIVVGIARPEGSHAKTVRKLEAIGRYGEWERNIELTEGRYVSLGTDGKIEFNKAVRFIESVLPESPNHAMKKKDVLELRKGPDTGFSQTTADEAFTWLVENRRIRTEQRMNERGKPKVYWKPIRD
jgi:hypothetical protein